MTPLDWPNDYIGIPWLDGGRTREGCDCYGLVRLALSDQFGIEVDAYDQFYTSTTADRYKIAGTIRANLSLDGWQPVLRAQAQPGDVALFVICGLPLHCGVMVARDVMLHIRSGVDAVTESINSIVWAKRLEGMYRHG